MLQGKIIWGSGFFFVIVTFRPWGKKAIYPLYNGFFQRVLLKMPFTPLTWHFEEHTLEKSSVLAKTPLKAMLPQKPPI